MNPDNRDPNRRTAAERAVIRRIAIVNAAEEKVGGKPPTAGSPEWDRALIDATTEHDRKAEPTKGAKVGAWVILGMALLIVAVLVGPLVGRMALVVSGWYWWGWGWL